MSCVVLVFAVYLYFLSTKTVSFVFAMRNVRLINLSSNKIIRFCFRLFASQLQLSDVCKTKQKQLQTANSEQRQVVVNGQQQTSALLQAMKANMEASRPPVLQQQPPQPPPAEQNKQFVVTPDFVQQSMLIYHPSVIVYNPNCAYPMQNDFIRHN